MRYLTLDFEVCDSNESLHIHLLNLDKERDKSPLLSRDDLDIFDVRMARISQNPNPNDAEWLKEIGSKLYHTLFSKDSEGSEGWEDYGQQAMETSQQKRLGLQINIYAKGELAQKMPWELLYDSKVGQFIGGSPKNVIVRVPPKQKYLHKQQIIASHQETVRIILASASSIRMNPTHFDQEFTAIQKCLSHLPNNSIEIFSTPHVSWDEFTKCLLEKKPHILHLVAHGTEEGVFFEKDNNPELVKYTDLSNFLVSLDDLKMIVFSICDSGTILSQKTLFNLPPEIPSVKRVWAILVTRTTISAAASLSFSKDLYHALVNGYSLTYAVGYARHNLARSNTPEALQWSIPMLYQATDVIPFPSDWKEYWKEQRQKTPPPEQIPSPQPAIQFSNEPISAYLKRIVNRVANENPTFLPLFILRNSEQAHQFRHPFPLSVSGPDDSTKSLEKWVVQLHRQEDHQVLILGGGPGSGKTMMLGHLAVTLALQWRSWNPFKFKPFPIVIKAKKAAQILYSQTDKLSPDKLDKLWLLFDDAVDIPPAGVLRYLREQGRAWLLVDGLDEITQQEERKQLVDELNNFVTYRRGNLLLITSRLTDLEWDKYPHLKMARLVESQAFLQWLIQNKKCEKHQLPHWDLPHLAWIKTPLGLTLLSRLKPDDTRPLRVKQAKLYKDYVFTILTKEKAGDDQNEPLPLVEWAYQLQTGETTQVPPIPKRFLPPVSEGLLQQNEKESHQFSFIHPSFQEYLAAKYLYLARQDNITAWISEVLVQAPSHWEQVAVFLTEILSFEQRMVFLEGLLVEAERAEKRLLAQIVAHCLLMIPWDKSISELAIRLLRCPSVAINMTNLVHALLTNPRLCQASLIILTQDDEKWQETFWVRVLRWLLEYPERLIWKQWIAFVTRLPQWHPALKPVLATDQDKIPSRWLSEWLWLQRRIDQPAALQGLKKVLLTPPNEHPDTLLALLAMLLEVDKDSAWQALTFYLNDASDEAYRVAALLRPWWHKSRLPPPGNNRLRQHYARLAAYEFSLFGIEITLERSTALKDAWPLDRNTPLHCLSRIDNGPMGEGWASAGIPAATEAAVLGALVVRQLNHEQGALPDLLEYSVAKIQALTFLGWLAWELGAESDKLIEALESSAFNEGSSQDLQETVNKLRTQITKPVQRLSPEEVQKFVACRDDRQRLQMAVKSHGLETTAETPVGVLLAAPNEVESAGLLDLLLSFSQEVIH